MRSFGITASALVHYLKFHVAHFVKNGESVAVLIVDCGHSLILKRYGRSVIFVRICVRFIKLRFSVADKDINAMADLIGMVLRLLATLLAAGGTVLVLFYLAE